jgi:hypothetical protein
MRIPIHVFRFFLSPGVMIGLGGSCLWGSHFDMRSVKAAVEFKF